MSALRPLIVIGIILAACGFADTLLGEYVGPLEYIGYLVFDYSEGNNPINNIVFTVDPTIANNLLIVDVPSPWSHSYASGALTLSGGSLNPGGGVSVMVSLDKYFVDGEYSVNSVGTTTAGEVSQAEGALLVGNLYLLRAIGMASAYRNPLAAAVAILIFLDLILTLRRKRPTVEVLEPVVQSDHEAREDFIRKLSIEYSEDPDSDTSKPEPDPDSTDTADEPDSVIPELAVTTEEEDSKTPDKTHIDPLRPWSDDIKWDLPDLVVEDKALASTPEEIAEVLGFALTYGTEKSSEDDESKPEETDTSPPPDTSEYDDSDLPGLDEIDDTDTPSDDPSEYDDSDLPGLDDLDEPDTSSPPDSSEYDDSDLPGLEDTESEPKIGYYKFMPRTSAFVPFLVTSSESDTETPPTDSSVDDKDAIDDTESDTKTRSWRERIVTDDQDVSRWVTSQSTPEVDLQSGSDLPPEPDSTSLETLVHGKIDGKPMFFPFIMGSNTDENESTKTRVKELGLEETDLKKLGESKIDFEKPPTETVLNGIRITPRLSGQGTLLLEDPPTLITRLNFEAKPSETRIPLPFEGDILKPRLGQLIENEVSPDGKVNGYYRVYYGPIPQYIGGISLVDMQGNLMFPGEEGAMKIEFDPLLGVPARSNLPILINTRIGELFKLEEKPEPPETIILLDVKISTSED